MNYTQRRHIADTNDVTHVYCDVISSTIRKSLFTLQIYSFVVTICVQMEPKREVSFSNRNTVRDAPPNTTYYESVRERTPEFLLEFVNSGVHDFGTLEFLLVRELRSS